MLSGKKELVGSGFIRDVYLVEWKGRELAVKFLREDYEERASEGLAEYIHRWEAAALDAVSDTYVYMVRASESNVSPARTYFPPPSCILYSFLRRRL